MNKDHADRVQRILDFEMVSPYEKEQLLVEPVYAVNYLPSAKKEQLKTFDRMDIGECAALALEKMMKDVDPRTGLTKKFIQENADNVEFLLWFELYGYCCHLLAKIDKAEGGL